jgi:hypothetical protein
MRVAEPVGMEWDVQVVGRVDAGGARARRRP